MQRSKMISMESVREQRRRCADLERRAQVEGWFKGEPHCGVIFDGILCWNGSRTGMLQAQSCPDYVYGFKTEEFATKLCTANGSWFHGAEGQPWTNFSLCEAPPTSALLPAHQADIELMERWTPVVKRMAQVGYAVSFVTLIAALLVLSSIKRLRCPRNSLHKHLFASFLLRASVTLLKDWLFVQGLGLSHDVIVETDGAMHFLKGANWECKLITSLWQYFIMANYSWILMEGLYLHNLIFMALFSDTSAIRMYVVLGWGLPLLFVGPWVTARLLLEDEFCWTTNNSHLFLLIRLPIVLSVLISFGLFINISRVLLTKLRFTPFLERRRTRYRRFARSTLVLVPLFGVHYAVFLAMSCGIDRYPRLELAWLFCDQFFASFQGLFVSLLYCLLNAEVRAEVARKWGLLLNGRRRSTCGLSGGSRGYGGGRGGGVMGALVGSWRPARGASLTSVLTSDTLVRIKPAAISSCNRPAASQPSRRAEPLFPASARRSRLQLAQPTSAADAPQLHSSPEEQERYDEYYEEHYEEHYEQPYGDQAPPLPLKEEPQEQPKRLLQMAELGRGHSRIRTISASEDERERVRCAQA